MMKVVQILPAPCDPQTGDPLMRVAHFEYFSRIVVSPVIAWALVEYQLELDDRTDAKLEPVYIDDCEGCAETRIARTGGFMDIDVMGGSHVSDVLLRPGEQVDGLSEWILVHGRFAMAHIKTKDVPRRGAWESKYVDVDTEACLKTLHEAQASTKVEGE